MTRASGIIAEYSEKNVFIFSGSFHRSMQTCVEQKNIRDRKDNITAMHCV